MSCQFLIGRQIKMCGAFNGALVLSSEELDSKCNGANCVNCPIYKKCMKRGSKLPLYEYTKDHKDFVLPQV